MVDNLVELVKTKLNNNTAVVNYTGPKELKDGRTFIFHRDNEGWTLYQGCELIVGDTTLRYAVICALDVVDLNQFY